MDLLGGGDIATSIIQPQALPQTQQPDLLDGGNNFLEMTQNGMPTSM
jgi:hypothetical protein